MFVCLFVCVSANPTVRQCSTAVQCSAVHLGVYLHTESLPLSARRGSEVARHRVQRPALPAFQALKKLSIRLLVQAVLQSWNGFIYVLCRVIFFFNFLEKNISYFTNFSATFVVS